MLNRWHRSYRFYDHEYRHHASVCQLPAVASRSRRLAPQLVALQAVVEQLQKQLAAALKNSSNSSKPPSSDIVKPPKPQPPAGQPRRKPGGQPGHTAHQRELFPPEMLACAPTDYLLDACPGCGGHLHLTDAEPIQVVQQVDIRRRAPGDPRAPQSSELVPSLSQDPLRTAPALDRAGRPGRAAADHRHRLPQGGLSRLVLDHPQVHPRCYRLDHLSRAIGQDHRQGQPGTRAALRGTPGPFADQDFLNVDETGHKQNRQRQWTWCFRAELYTLFKIDPTRSGDVLIEVLGTEFDGVLGCDYFSAYRRYHREFGVALQFCLAHLIRDVKFLTTLPEPGIGPMASGCSAACGRCSR